MGKGILVVFAWIAMLSSPAASQAATFFVDRTDDPGPGGRFCDVLVPMDCSLRDAVLSSNFSPDDDRINVPAGRYELGQGAGDDTALIGDLDLLNSAGLVIAGTGASVVTIDGNSLDRIFHRPAVGGAKGVFISGLTLTGGSAASGPGGAVLNEGSLSLMEPRTFGLSGVAITDSDAGGHGGGVASIGSGASSNELTIDFSALGPGNVATGAGGGVHVREGAASLTNVTISGNGAGIGGGLGVRASATDTTVTLLNSTVAGNSAVSGGNLGAEAAGPDQARVQLRNSIVSGGGATTAGTENCGADAAPNAAFESQGHNLEAHATAPTDQCLNPQAVGDLTATDAFLGPLAANGGQTVTHALLGGSPAIDAVFSGCPPPTLDQRGIVRPQEARCDIGAFELKLPVPPAPVPTAFCKGRRATIVGTRFGERLSGTPRRDVIVALGGADAINGGGGRDVICAGGGNDLVTAGGGPDTVSGDAGNDKVTGNAGNDRLLGGRGRDHLDGLGGNDILRGEGGNDTLLGGLGNDRLIGGPGSRDRIDGAGGRDVERQ
jgi:Ca2+-binding RTX toxin-like protein